MGIERRDIQSRLAEAPAVTVGVPGEQSATDARVLLRACSNRFALPVLRLFFAQNWVEPDQVVELSTMIREAREHKTHLRDDRMAWEALTIFALYVYFQVTDLAEIAEHLCIAESTVKSWVSAIYSAFDLEPNGFKSRAARRRELRLKAVQEGYVTSTSWLCRISEALDRGPFLLENGDQKQLR